MSFVGRCFCKCDRGIRMNSIARGDSSDLRKADAPRRDRTRAYVKILQCTLVREGV